MAAKSAEAIERGNAAHREIYHWYKSHGICPRCKKAIQDPGRVYCGPCYRRLRNQMERRDPGAVNRKAYQKARRERLIAAGLCIDCGKEKATGGTLRCGKCLEKARESNHKYRIIQKIERTAREARER